MRYVHRFDPWADSALYDSDPTTGQRTALKIYDGWLVEKCRQQGAGWDDAPGVSVKFEESMYKPIGDGPLLPFAKRDEMLTSSKTGEAGDGRGAPDSCTVAAGKHPATPASLMGLEGLVRAALENPNLGGRLVAVSATDLAPGLAALSLSL
ncbi:hypothetical protein BDZ91DRAFT_731606 [Kalaharituber pfeilii]|nr:hypothetical protein BDZ91DRAFT_731606 [Kalaharituber pfeilii]